MEPGSNCGNCRYFSKSICVFDPPKVVVSHYYGNGGGNTTVWPEVEETEWCGKWEFKSDV